MGNNLTQCMGETTIPVSNFKPQKSHSFLSVEQQKMFNKLKQQLKETSDMNLFVSVYSQLFVESQYEELDLISFKMVLVGVPVPQKLKKTGSNIYLFKQKFDEYGRTRPALQIGNKIIDWNEASIVSIRTAESGSSTTFLKLGKLQMKYEVQKKVCTLNTIFNKQNRLSMSLSNGTRLCFFMKQVEQLLMETVKLLLMKFSLLLIFLQSFLPAFPNTCLLFVKIQKMAHHTTTMKVNASFSTLTKS